MTWFFALLIVVAMGIVAVVATGRGGSMADVYDDRPDSRVQADGPLTASDVRRVRFSTAFRGYRMSEVDALLDRISAELEPSNPESPELEPSNPESPELEPSNPEPSDTDSQEA